MALGIDIFSDGMTCSGSGDHNQSHWENYGIIGLTPRRNEPFIWNNPRALRRSTQGPYISMTQAWSEFMADKDGEAKCEWPTTIGNTDKLPAENLIAEAIRQNVPQSELTKTVISIDNTLNEFQQDALIKGLRFNGFIRAELLWRPVAIALHHLNSVGRDQFKEGDILSIVDLDSYLPELTVLRLKLYRDELVPVRDLPPKSSPLDDVYSSFKLKREFIGKITDNPEVEDQLINGPFAREYFSFMEGKSHDEIFICNGLSYSKFPLDSNWRKEIADYSVGDTNFINLRDQILELEDYQSSDHKIWNGFPCRIQDPGIFTESEIVVDNMAVAKGAADYAQRQLEDRPTFLDTLPGLEIFSQIEGKGFEFFTLIDKGEVEGGNKITTKKPVTRFKLEKNTDEFNSILRDMTTKEVKKLVTGIPSHNYDYNVPLIIRAEMMPANGHAIVTIEGDTEHKDVFDRQRRIQLNWKMMKPHKIVDPYSGPKAYQISGWVVSDQECREIVEKIISEDLSMNYDATYKNRVVKYNKLHRYWGYYYPWGEFLGEPTRGMFGTKKESNDEIDRLAKGISEIIYNKVHAIDKRHQYLNYMYRYAPDKFIQELRELYSSENPDLNINTIYGVGRTFYRPEDFELFVDFFIKKSLENGYPDYPYGNRRNTVAFIWSFFRPLCFYERTNLIPKEKAESVLRCINTYVNNNGPFRPRSNVVKYILSSILFSLRFRTSGRMFLTEGSELRLDMEDIIKNKLPQIPYPPAMFETVKIDKLNDFVLRFIEEKQTNEDIKALRGLITHSG